ncbi:hypothetical protein [Arsenophonus nasoniae]|nr:hypothetical protein [Arsenophonus nasoniae]QBY42570.1 hypothetical protein ArsFIN_11270 [Arsenophonus nasoniae]WGM02486.1 hypothetical protein QE210_05205 [Arsenophonus nasoniae]CBA71429.1 conserved hypothetical protein [Arsenophonus nasoniae]
MLSDSNILFSELADVLRKLDISHLSTDEMLQLANSSEECWAGLCHNLHFLAKTLVSLADNKVSEFSLESLCQLGHGLSATALPFELSMEALITSISLLRTWAHSLKLYSLPQGNILTLIKIGSKSGSD